MSIGDRMNDFKPEVVDDLTWENWRSIRIIHHLMNGDPEPLIEFMREDGDMSQFDPRQLDLIAKVLCGESLRGKGRPKSEPNVLVLFEVAWFSEIEDFPLTSPKFTNNSAFHKAAEVMGVTPETAEDLWEKCTNKDKDHYRRQVRDQPL